MKIIKNEPPRKFTVGIDNKITISDCAKINLSPDEQVTFITDDNKEYDVARKNWGFYATPSVNNRLKSFNLKTALVKNTKDQIYVMLVESDKMQDFNKYLDEEKLSVINWLDEGIGCKKF